jgi:hypothetical protein
MQRLTYRKTVHGPRIARRIDPDCLQDLRPVLAPLFG